MGRIPIAIASLLFSTQLAAAGPNAYGTLFLHHATGLSYSTGSEPDWAAVSLPICAGADGRMDGTETEVAILYAAFPGDVMPAVKSVDLRITWLGDSVLEGLGGCGGTLSIDPPGTPMPGLWMSVEFPAARSDTLFPLAWFAIRAGVVEPVGALMLLPLPTGPAVFTSDDALPTYDDIFPLGILGINQDGNVPCPLRLVTRPGACCLEDGSCIIVKSENCSGVFFGAGFPCNPNPCRHACCLPDLSCQVITDEECEAAGGLIDRSSFDCEPEACTTVAACCTPELLCRMTTEWGCIAISGVWFRDVRDPVACENENFCCCPATIHTTWGAVKARY